MSSSKNIKDLVEPVPESLLDGKSSKEQVEVAKGYRAFTRLKDQETALSTQAYLKCAPLEQKIPKPHRRVPAKEGRQIVKINVPKALTSLGQGSSMKESLSNTSGLKAKQIASTLGTSKLEKTGEYTTVATDKKVKNTSPSERIALLYTPTSNVRTTGRNDQMRSYEYQVSFRNVDVPPPAKKDIKSDHRGVRGKDPSLSHFLPLEEFDNAEYEVMTPQEWVALGQESGGTPARSRFVSEEGGEEIWAPCRVVSYSEENDTFLIVWNDTGKQKHVKRLNIVFDSEDETLWQDRLQHAHELRQAAEAEVRLHLYVEGIDDGVITPVDEDQVDCILSLVAAEFPLQHLHVVEKCIAEMRTMYSFGIKRAVHEYQYRDPEEKARLVPLCLPQRVEAAPVSLDELLGTVDTPSPNFYDARSYIAENLFQTHALLYESLHSIHLRWQQFENNLLCDTKMKGIMLPCDLHVFEEAQSKCGSTVSDRLKDDWSSNVNTTIQNDLDVHFNFYIESIEKYRASRMSRFFNMVNITMSSQLRQLLVASIRNYTEFLQKYRIVLPNDFEVESDTIEEIDSDKAERLYWEGKAEEVKVRRAKEAAALEASTIDNKKPSKKDADVDDDEEREESEEKKTEKKEVGYLEFGIFENPTPYSSRILSMTQNANGIEPLFTVKLRSNGDAVMFDPLLEEVEDKVKGVFDNFFVFTERIKGVGDQLFPLLEMDENDFFLRPLNHHESVVMDAKEVIHRVLLENMQGPRQLQQMYQSFEYILKVEIDTLIDSFTTRKPAPTHHDFDLTLERLFRDMDRIRNRTLNEVKFELIKVECEDIKRSLIQKANNIADALMELLASQLTEETLRVRDQYEQINKRIRVQPNTPEELMELKQIVDGVPERLNNLGETFQHITEGNDLLTKYRFVTDMSDFEAYWNTMKCPKEINDELANWENNYSTFRSEFQNKLSICVESLTLNIVKLQDRVEKLADKSEASPPHDTYNEIRSIEDSIKEYQKEIQLYNSHEALFNKPQTQWSHIKDIKAAFEPHRDLWEVTYMSEKLDEYLTGPFDTLDGEQIENEVANWSRKINAVTKKIKDDKPLAVAKKTKKTIDAFSDYVPLIKALRNNLQAQHWRQIGRAIDESNPDLGEQTLEKELSNGEVRTLQYYLTKKLNDKEHLNRILEISETAAKTHQLESKLSAMEGEWKKINFDVEEYLETFKLKASEEVQQMLDDHIMKTQSIMGSPYIRMATNVEKIAKKWSDTLNNIQSIMDEWFKCQSTWAYLYPIFDSKDIAKSMPNESYKFSKIDENWRHIMDLTRNTPQVLSRCQDENLLKTLLDNNAQLDEILKKLHQFLETKRMAFPRFYFISNEELLQILSDSKDPYLVQPYLSKCFEGIKKIQFQESLDITAMESAEGEIVQFCKRVNPADHDNAVEAWLMQVENIMCESIRDHLRRARDDYRQRKRTEFIRHWPGQVVIAICALYWTMEATDAMATDGAAGLEQYYQLCRTQLDDLVLLVRDRNLKTVERCTLEALVVMEVHSRDITGELAEKGIDNANSFDWLAQLRYYWNEGHLDVMQINACLRYGYEYLGNTGRLVITPLTDRCYRTLMGALHLNYGGAPEGPAGTGKTETTKDLAKALAKQCVVYNCTDQITYKDMAKLFKGLSQAGAWGCFDEFNRIEVQVLSVIAQQVATIQDAIALKRMEFMFDGDMIKLKLGCAVFITMNPGYAGRAELPDNLKALFRPVAMMVPNYAMIGEIQLYSYGFLNGKDLAKKIVATYGLCSEQLSSQDHYDYGMRAVKAVLTAAGRLKRQYPDDDEQIIMLRSIQDVNLPKFLSQDVGLFGGIISDLFPGVVLPKPDYDVMTRCLTQVANDSNLQMTEYFKLKCFQTYEMIVVRHGMMLVGLSYGGKTAVLRTLSKSLGLMRQEKLEQKTRLITMNPKAITMGQLYGKMDATNEWADGVLARNFKTAASDTMPDRKWLVLDGPVDAVWIENMNTVLDDNKKLCLQNGDIIPMSKQMNMIFEVQDLQCASPATVSRCGMVYVEPDTLGHQCLIDSYMNTLPEMIKENEVYLTLITTLFDWLVEPLLKFVNKQAKTAIPQGNSVAVASLIKLFNCFMKEFDFTDSKKVEYEEREVTSKIEGWFLFALTWSIGGCLYNKDRIQFNAALLEAINAGGKKGLKLSIPLPEKRPLYEVVFEWDREPKFVDWLDTISEFKIQEGQQYHEIIVPTTDTERYKFLLKTCIENMLPILLVGDTGTGKTIMAKALLNGGLDKDSYVVNMIQFSAQTSANQTQELIDARCDKRKKGVYGPPINKKMLVFVDDLNMPMLEEYGAQPPIELLRQWSDHHGWYNHTKDNVDFREIVEMMFIAAMGPPGGGRNHVTPRFTRHFNTIAVPAFDDNTLKKIFGCLMDWICTKGYPSALRSMVPNIVSATVEVYQTLVEKLKPTPEKSHYTFNLRDVSKVFQGIAMANPARIQDSTKLIRLWVHETFRALADRFVDQADENWFVGVLGEVMQTQFKVSYKSVVPDENVLIADFMNDQRLYEEVDDMKSARAALEEQLDYYNQNVRGGQMDLVIFNYVIEHVARICRILKQPFGSALLIGVGGSGRTSCTKLATKIEEYDYFTVTMSKEYKRTDFLEDIKTVLMKAGKDGIPLAFTLADTQITDEAFLEDICNLLNTGEVPGLFAVDDLDNVAAALKNTAKEMGREISRDGLVSLFVERCRINMHIVLCFSPIGKVLRDRLRKFPSLVNCTTIDWFREWPQDGLFNVASRFLSEVELSDEHRVAIGECFVSFQESIRELGAQYLDEARQHTYVTPTSYLELLSTFKTLLGKKRAELTALRFRYDGGLDQLKATEEKVELMTQELEILKPQLKRTAKETDELIINVTKDNEEAEVIRAKVAVEEAAANKIAARAKSMKDDCQAKVDEAQPKLDEAQQAAAQLDNNELREMKALQKPPEKVKFVIEAVCNILGGAYKPKPVRNPQTQKVEYPYWEHAKAHVMTDKFKEIMRSFDVDTCSEQQIQDVQKYIKHKDFDPTKIGATSKACVGIVRWVIATEEYYQLNKIVKPLKAEAEVAQKEYDVAMQDLKQKMDELAIIDEQLNKKKAHLDQVKAKKKDLEDKVADTDTKLRRAVQLIEGLGGEKARYMLESERLAGEFSNVVGDVVLASATIAYLGPFQNKYRQSVAAKWLAMCKSKNIPGTSPFVFEKFVGNPIHIEDWKLQQLPSDSFSIDNALIMTNGARWPLLIDPQQQANRWIRNMERDAGLVVVRPTEGEYARTIANAVRVGDPVLLENVEEDVDPVLENLLLKRIVREGTGFTVTIGEPVEWNDKFRFYMTTKLPRPHYRPEVSTKVNLINFMITPGGLQDQLLQKVVWNERRDVEEKKTQMTIEAAANKAALKKTEDTILELLSQEGNLLDNEQAVQELNSAKIQSDKNAIRQAEIEEMEKKSDKTRAEFIPVAHLGASLFFCVSELANIDPMYQYSLQFYISLFQQSLIESEKSEEIKERIENIKDYFKKSLYTRICRSLFAKDQLLFSFIMCLKIFDVDPVEVRWLLVGGMEQDKGLTKNPIPWLPDLNWKFVWRASTQLPAFSQLCAQVEEHQDVLKEFFQSTDPLSIELPGELGALEGIQRLIFIRCFRTDKIVPAVTKYVIDKMGDTYVEPPLFNLEEIVDELQHDASVPIIFVLSPGADPNAELDRTAEIKGMDGKRIQKLSLGQGQDVIATEMIAEGRRAGNWVLLQNCHLFHSFMPTLARVIEDYSREGVKDDIHRDFRLWLTSLPAEAFPVSVLQNGVKLVQEPPKGLKSNLLRSYLSDPIAQQKFFYSCNKPEIWRKLLFGLCFFHSLVQERRKFGPLGWNRPYEFNDTDMRISVRQLHMFINENAEVPYEALMYLTGHCNYGGRVTDDWDRRCLMATLEVFFTSEILHDSYRFDEDAPEYSAPPHGEYETYVEHIKTKLPLAQRPAVFGLHANADITKDEREAKLLLDSTLATQPREGGSGGGAALDPKTIVHRLAAEVYGRFPKMFDMDAVIEKYPTTYSQSMNTVLRQELIRYNRLLQIILSSLVDLQKAIKGEVVMSADLEALFNSMYDGKIPKLWMGRSYPSLKPFGAYVNDLLQRLNFLQKWIDNGPPPVFWISGFFFTQSFLTGVRQNYARKKRIEIDKLGWDFTIMHEPDYADAPEDGCYVNGLFLEGAGWDHDNKLLCESKPKELFIEFPIIFLMPTNLDEIPSRSTYDCPCYKTTDRRGVLSTTGHSTNFIMVVKLPKAQDKPESHWVKRGTALFTQLDY